MFSGYRAKPKQAANVQTFQFLNDVAEFERKATMLRSKITLHSVFEKTGSN
jgi:hypothetical protein